MNDTTALLQGTLDLLILKALALGEQHGLGIARRIGLLTNGAFEVKPGSLFPALHRMEQSGWLKASWGASEAGRRAKYYRLTRSGKTRLESEISRWQLIARAIGGALTFTESPEPAQ